MRPSAARALLLHALPLLVAGCGLTKTAGSDIRVHSEMLPWAQVSGHRTYRWWAPPLIERRGGYSEREARIDWQVRKAVDGSLAARGYALDAAGRPDFVVSYHVAIEQDSTSSFQDYLTYRAEGGPKDMGEAFIGYDRGVLELDFEDAVTRRVAWRAVASAVVDGGAGGRIEPAVRQMIDRFPPAAR
jgi:hypothetical protein